MFCVELSSAPAGLLSVILEVAGTLLLYIFVPVLQSINCIIPIAKRGEMSDPTVEFCQSADVYTTNLSVEISLLWLYTNKLLKKFQ